MLFFMDKFTKLCLLLSLLFFMISAAPVSDKSIPPIATYPEKAISESVSSPAPSPSFSFSLKKEYSRLSKWLQPEKKNATKWVNWVVITRWSAFTLGMIFLLWGVVAGSAGLSIFGGILWLVWLIALCIPKPSPPPPPVPTEMITITTNPQDAKIYTVYDGKKEFKGQGSITIKATKGYYTNILVEREGYFPKSGRVEYGDSKNIEVELEADEAFSSSIQTDIANVDMTVNSSKSDQEAFKVIASIVTSYFDVLETSDGTTGYLRTAWAVKSFKTSTIRTRVIVKLSTSTPTVYKVKLVSEYSNIPGKSAKEDEAFSEWSRILRKYENMIPELQSRLK